jgi:hypothetical protein
MTLRVARLDRVHIRIARRGPPVPKAALGGVAHLGAAVEVIGRGLAVGIGIGILLIAGPGAVSLTTIGVLAIGSALVSWSE